MIKPKYSSEAKKSRISGTVKVEIIIEPGSGNVISAKAVSGNTLLRKSAEEAALKTKFSHTNDVSRNVKVIAFLIYKFYTNGKVEF